MTDNLSTELDRTSIPTPEAQADALAYLTRTGNADLLQILGLADHDPNIVDGHRICPGCKKPLPPNGAGACRRVGCTASGRKSAAKNAAKSAVAR